MEYEFQISMDSILAYLISVAFWIWSSLIMLDYILHKLK